ncbi:MAG: hypothetical protein ACQET6_20710 [Bacillota bacterium]|uniref:hypothetical protein n=1 Tax=Rossellomorea TaxID=2837508 RepID=UPI0005CA7B42|nr:hypothetical protein [Rossellomorea aquimaris]
MKKKTVAVTTIFFTFFGFAWLIESQDRFNRGIIEVEDPTSMNIRPVQYGETEEVEEEVTREPIRQRQPFRSREYIRVVPHSNPGTQQ